MRKRRKILTEPQKQEIRQRYLVQNISQVDLAKEYDIGIATLQRIVFGVRRYDEPYPFSVDIPDYTHEQQVSGEVKHVGGMQNFYETTKHYHFHEDDDFWKRGHSMPYDDELPKPEHRVHPRSSPSSARSRAIFKHDYDGS